MGEEMDTKRKLLRLKKWLNIPNVAQYLSNSFKGEVTEADVLKFVLEGRLKLSIYFPTEAWARCGLVVQFQEAEWIEGDFLLKLHRDILPLKDARLWMDDDQLIKLYEDIEHRDKDLPRRALKSLVVSDQCHEETSEQNEFMRKLVWRPYEIPANWDPDEQDFYKKLCDFLGQNSLKFLNLAVEDELINGVWDFPMYPGARGEINRRYHKLENMPFDHHFYHELFVKSENGSKMCRLRSENVSGPLINNPPLVSNEDFLSLPDNYHRIFQMVDAAEDDSEGSQEEALDDFAEDFFSDEKTQLYLDQRLEFPANELPMDSVLVIRAEALIDFEQRYLEEIIEPISPLPPVRDNEIPGDSIFTGREEIRNCFDGKSWSQIRNYVKKGLVMTYTNEPKKRPQVKLSNVIKFKAEKEKK